MINAGKYRHKITIYRTVFEEDNFGFQTEEKIEVVLTPYASVKTTKGMTLIKNNSDFETEINRDMLIDFNGKTYSIDYLNNVDELNVELEIQAKEVTH